MIQRVVFHRRFSEKWSPIGLTGQITPALRWSTLRWGLEDDPHREAGFQRQRGRLARIVGLLRFAEIGRSQEALATQGGWKDAITAPPIMEPERFHDRTRASQAAISLPVRLNGQKPSPAAKVSLSWKVDNESLNLSGGGQEKYQAYQMVFFEFPCWHIRLTTS